MMAAEGIGQKVLSLSPFLFAYGKEPSSASRWCRESNDALAAICKAYPTQFQTLGIVPLQGPSVAIEEMKRCLQDLKFPGIEIGTQVRGQDLLITSLSGIAYPNSTSATSSATRWKRRSEPPFCSGGLFLNATPKCVFAFLTGDVLYRFW